MIRTLPLSKSAWLDWANRGVEPGVRHGEAGVIILPVFPGGFLFSRHRGGSKDNWKDWSATASIAVALRSVAPGTLPGSCLLMRLH